MNEIVDLRGTRDGEPASYAVQRNGQLIQNAIQLTAGAVHAFFQHARQQQGETSVSAEAATASALPLRLGMQFQDYDFSQRPPIRMDAADMHSFLGVEFKVTWNRELELETPRDESGAPLTVVQYVTKINAAGEQRTVHVRVPYTAFIEFKQRASDPWDRLKAAVANAFEARLQRPRYAPRDGEVVEMSTEEVLNDNEH